MVRDRLSGLALYLLSGALIASAGQFLEAPQYTTGVNPQAVAVGDFNRDGNSDIAVVNSTSNTVSVLLGNGDGTFKSKVDYATGTLLKASRSEISTETGSQTWQSQIRPAIPSASSWEMAMGHSRRKWITRQGTSLKVWRSEISIMTVSLISSSRMR